MNTALEQKPFLTASEAAEFLHTSTASLERWRREGKGGDFPEWRRIGKRRIVYPTAKLLDYVNRTGGSK